MEQTNVGLLKHLASLEDDLAKILESRLNSPVVLFVAFLSLAKFQGWTVLPPDEMSDLQICELVKEAIVNASAGIRLKYQRELLKENGLGRSDADTIAWSLINKLRKLGLMRPEPNPNKEKEKQVT